MKITIEQNVIDMPVGTLTVAGWTGRNRAAVDHHIEELKAIGVPAPSTCPLFYQVSPELASQATQQQFLGDKSSGEVEPVLLFDGQSLYLTTGSDHTDRGWETVSVAVSKQLCPKPLASAAWPLDTVLDHLDQLALRSWVRDAEQADWQLYQDGTFAQILPLQTLFESSGIRQRHQPNTWSVMLCGTVPTIGEIRPYREFKFEIHDPVLNRTLGSQYVCSVLPVVS